MARGKLTDIKSDVSSDSGAVLWSFVKGEALEFPVLLDFLDNAPITSYTFEAVVIEAANVADQSDRPTQVEPVSPAMTTLTVRLPDLRGPWDALAGYNYENVVLYSGKYYRLMNGVNRINATPPDLDPLWEETTLNRVYIQFPETLASDWKVSPTVLGNVYGFFELRVTEPANVVFTRTWKPVRGMVEVLFSPTDVVP